MTEQERIARADRAQRAWDEFFAPMISELKSVYGDRLVEVANIELARDKRADKITALSNALKIVTTLEAGMLEAIKDGEVARVDKLRSEKIEQMTEPQRRLLKVIPY